MGKYFFANHFMSYMVKRNYATTNVFIYLYDRKNMQMISVKALTSYTWRPLNNVFFLHLGDSAEFFTLGNVSKNIFFSFSFILNRVLLMSFKEI